MRALRSAFLSAGIPEDVVMKLPSSFEIIGDIAILEIEEKIVERYKKEIVSALLSLNKSINVVVNKVGDVEGIYRTAKYKVLFYNKKNRMYKNISKIATPKSVTETIHRELGCVYFLDISKVFFTSKLSFERERIAKQVSPGENVLVMFAGVGPFPICIGKYSEANKIVGVEINKHAVSYFKINTQLNKLNGKVLPILGDVGEIEFSFKFDRIVMPAPKNAPDFLEHVVSFANDKRCYVHLYTFASEEEILQKKKEEEILNRIRDLNYNCKILFRRKCGTISPRNYRFVFDIMIWS